MAVNIGSNWEISVFEVAAGSASVPRMRSCGGIGRDARAVKFDFISRVFRRGGKGSSRKSAGSSVASRNKRPGRRSLELPAWSRVLLKGLGVVLTLLLLVGALHQAFYSYYTRSKSLFVVRDTDENVRIDTGKTVTPDLIKQFLGIEDGVNLFSINVGEKREELLNAAPSIKDLSIVRYMPDSLEISIIERDPVVRIGLDGRVADDEGVVFVRYKNTSGLPVITQSTGPQKAKPGDRLKEMDLAAVRLAASTFRSECKFRMYSLDSSNARYILLTFPDGRTAKIAWEDMTGFTRKSEQKMIKQYDNLVQCMLLDIGKIHYSWDAQHEGRIFGKRRNFAD